MAGSNIEAQYLQEVNLLPTLARRQEPVVYWLRHFFDPSRPPSSRGGTVIRQADQPSLAVKVGRAYERQHPLIKVGGPWIVQQVVDRPSGVFITTHVGTTNRAEPGKCGDDCKNYAFFNGEALVVGASANSDQAPRTFSIDPSNTADRDVRGQLATMVRGMATGDSRNDPVFGGPGSEVFQVFARMAGPHHFDQEVTGRVAAANLARHIGALYIGGTPGIRPQPAQQS